MLAIIVAMDNNNLIGANNALPWHLPADLAYFKHITMGHTIVMGRNTYLSIGKPLPGRKNVVLSRNPDFNAEGCTIIRSLEEITHQNDKVFIIGGASLYEQTLPLADMLYITQIDTECVGDAYFPPIDSSWQLVNEISHTKDEKNNYDYTFKTFQC